MFLQFCTPPILYSFTLSAECLDTIPALNKTHKCCNIAIFSSHFWDILKLKLNPLSFPIEQVKQPSASVNPVSQLSFKLGKMSLCFNSIDLILFYL